jgi:hypothetical protein
MLVYGLSSLRFRTISFPGACDTVMAGPVARPDQQEEDEQP